MLLFEGKYVKKDNNISVYPEINFPKFAFLYSPCKILILEESQFIVLIQFGPIL